MKKKLLTIFLAFILAMSVFVFAACGEEQEAKVTLGMPLNARIVSAALNWDAGYNWRYVIELLYVEIKVEDIDNDTYNIMTVAHPVSRISVRFEDLNMVSGAYRLSVRGLGFVYNQYRTFLDSAWSNLTYTNIGLPQEPRNLRWYARLIDDRYNQLMWDLGREGFPYRHNVRITNSAGEVIFYAQAQEHRWHFNFPLYALLSQNDTYTVGVQAVTRFGFGLAQTNTWYLEGSTSNFVEKVIVLEN